MKQIDKFQNHHKIYTHYMGLYHFSYISTQYLMTSEENHFMAITNAQ